MNSGDTSEINALSTNEMNVLNASKVLYHFPRSLPILPHYLTSYSYLYECS